MERVATQPIFEKFRPTELQVPPSKLQPTEGFLFEFELGRIMIQELGSYVEGYGDPTTQTSTPKLVEEVVSEIMKAYKVVELFQTMVIVNLNMRNLTMKVNTLKNILVMKEKEKAMLQEELDKERKFQKGYEHNVEIWRNNRLEAEHKNIVFIKKL